MASTLYEQAPRGWLMDIIWDERKDLSNRQKHGVSFEEASELLRSDRDHLELYDEAHSDSEDRYISIGVIIRGVVLVVWTERDDELIRIISARWATPRETDLYHSYMAGHA